jgi:hypothetical protein
MKRILKLGLKGLLILIPSLMLLIGLLIYFDVLWLMAPYYEIEQETELTVPVMDMKAYDGIINTHRRPYIFTITTPGGGAVCIMGVDHTKNPEDRGVDSIRHYWSAFDADVALVEGRVGNLFTWLQDPLEALGEGGLVTSLANSKGVDLYSWEPQRQDEIDYLLVRYSPEEIAMFYTFRPYFSNMRYQTYPDPEAALQRYLGDRTDYPGIEGVFTSWEQLDAKWKADHPGIEWRDFGAGHSFPGGYLFEIGNAINIMRDEHMIMSIVDLMRKGRRVFVTMGASHAPRIEETLRTALEG